MKKKRLLFFVLSFLLLLLSLAGGQERRGPLSLEEIEYLMLEGVTPKRVVTLVGEYGVKFEVTEEVRERLRRAGVDAEVMGAVERAGAEFLKRELATAQRRLKEQYVQQAETAKKRGEWTQAQEHYEEARKIDPQDRTLAAAVQEMRRMQEQGEARSRAGMA